MLTKEIICAYAPFGVKVMGFPYSGLPNEERKVFPLKGELKGFNDNNIIVLFQDTNGHNWDSTVNVTIYDFKLILRPISSLTKPITHNGETFVPREKLESLNLDGWLNYWDILCKKGYKCNRTCIKCGLKKISWEAAKLLHEWKFDLYGLLESGHAIELKEVDNG